LLVKCLKGDVWQSGYGRCLLATSLAPLMLVGGLISISSLSV